MRRILRKVAADKHHELGDISTLADPSVVELIVQMSGLALAASSAVSKSTHPFNQLDHRGTDRHVINEHMLKGRRCYGLLYRSPAMPSPIPLVSRAIRLSNGM